MQVCILEIFLILENEQRIGQIKLERSKRESFKKGNYLFSFT